MIDISKIIVGLGTAHTGRTPGKCAPDKSFREAVYSREIVPRVREELEKRGIKTFVDYEPLEPKPEWISKIWRIERNRELEYRVRVVNSYCSKYGKDHVLFVSMHTDASPGAGWQEARGLSVRVSPLASSKSKRLAKLLYEAGDRHGLRGNRSVPSGKFWVQSLYVLNETACPAVLTETLFQNNREDVKFLLSEEGRKAVVDYHVEGIINYINSL